MSNIRTCCPSDIDREVVSLGTTRRDARIAGESDLGVDTVTKDDEDHGTEELGRGLLQDHAKDAAVRIMTMAEGGSVGLTDTWTTG